MSAVLIYADNCKYCHEVISFVRDHPVIIPMIRTHNINKQGIPDGVVRVPMIVTSSGEKYIGLEALRWIENIVPTTFEGNTGNLGYSFDEPFDGVGDGFPLDSYGMPLSPQLTKDLKEKIDKPLNEAYADVKKKFKTN